MTIEKPTLYRLILENLRSLPVAINAIVLIVLLSMIGSIVPQQQPIPDDLEYLEQNRAQIAAFIEMHPEPWRDILLNLRLDSMNYNELKLYIEKYGQLRFVVIKVLGFTDIYNVWYYSLLLAWVGASALVCTYFRFIGLIKNRVRLSARKQVRGWASFFLHMSLVLILVSGALNKIIGVSSLITLEENKKASIVIDSSTNKHWLIKLILKPIVKPKYFDVELLDFSIPLDKIQSAAVTNEQANMSESEKLFNQLAVKDFISSVVIIGNGVEAEYKVSMNRPFTYRNVRFYQMSYQQNIKLNIIDSKSKKLKILPLTPRLPVQATDLGYIELTDDVQPQNAVDPVFELIDVKHGVVWQAEKSSGFQDPLARVNVYDPATGKLELSAIVDTNSSVKYKEYELRLDKNVTYFSTLSYKSAPGEWLMYLGFTLLITSSSVLIFTISKR